MSGQISAAWVRSEHWRARHIGGKSGTWNRQPRSSGLEPWLFATTRIHTLIVGSKVSSVLYMVICQGQIYTF